MPLYGKNTVLEDSFWAPDVLPADRVFQPSIIQESLDNFELMIDNDRHMSCYRCAFFALEADLLSH